MNSKIVLDLLPKKKRKNTDITKTYQESIKSHFKTRWFERVGTTLTEAKYQRLKVVVRSQGEKILVQDNGRVRYMVKFEGITFKVIFDPNKTELVTLLSLGKK